MYELKKNGKVFTSKFVGTGHSSYEKRIYRAAVSQRLRTTGLDSDLHVATSPISPAVNTLVGNKHCRFLSMIVFWRFSARISAMSSAFRTHLEHFLGLSNRMPD